MRNTFIAALLTCITTVDAIAQTANNFEQLTPTANPAYMLLGISPTEIERPGTPKEFAASLNSAIVNGRLAPNFVMEFNPYQLATKKKKLSYSEEAVGFTFEKSKFGSNVLNNLVISMATSETDSAMLGQLSSGTSFAIGAKTILFNGKPTAATYSALLSLTASFSEENIYNDLINTIEVTDDSLITNEFIEQTLNSALVSHKQRATSGGLSEARRNRGYEIISTRIKRKINEKMIYGPANRKKEILKYLRNSAYDLQAQQAGFLQKTNKRFAFAREGFIMDANGAYMGHVQGNDWDSVAFGKWAAWTTLSYRQNVDQSFENVALIDVMGLLRVTGNNVLVDSASLYFDYGLKLRFVINRFAISGEYIGRHAFGNVLNTSGSRYTDRITASVEYRLSNLITLKTSFGRTFDGNTSVYDAPGSSTPLFGVAGLSLSFLQNQ